jgi:hypothetical protein
MSALLPKADIDRCECDVRICANTVRLGRASRTMLKGPAVALRTRVNPPSRMTSRGYPTLADLKAKWQRKER